MPNFGEQFRTEIAVRLQAEGADQAALIQKELARVKDEAANLSREWVDGTKTSAEFLDAMRKLTTEFGAWTRAAKDVDAAVDGQSASYRKLVAEMQRDSDQINKLLSDEAEAAERAAIREEQAFERVVIDHEKYLARIEADEARAAATTSRAAVAQADMGRSGRQAAMGMLDLSRALQDFAQGGFPAIINNLEGIGRGIPAMLANPMALLTSFPAILTAVGVAALELYQHWDKLTGLFVKTYGIPEGVRGLEDVTKALQAAKKEMDALAEKTSLTFDQLSRFYELEFKHDVLKKEAEAAKGAEALKKTEEPEAKQYADAAKKVAERFGGGANLEREIRDYVEKELGHIITPAWTEIKTDLAGRTKTIEHAAVVRFKDLITGTFTNDLQATVNQLMADLSKGDEATFKFMGNRALKGEAARIFRAFDPETIKAIDKANEEEQANIEEAGRLAHEQAERAAADRAKLDAAAERNEQAMRTARDQAISQDISTFGTKEAHGGLLEGEVRKLAAEKVKPEDMLDRLLGPEKERLRGAHVEEGNLDAVARGLANKAREAALAKLTASPEFARGGLEAAARAAIEAGQDKAEKPEVTHHAARLGAQFKEDLDRAILGHAARDETVEQVRAAMAPQIRRRVGLDVEVDPSQVDAVAGKILDVAVERTNAILVARGGGLRRGEAPPGPPPAPGAVKAPARPARPKAAPKARAAPGRARGQQVPPPRQAPAPGPAVARKLLQERQVKVIGQEQARERGVERARDVAARPAIARDIMVRSGGMVSPEQAEHGAVQYQSLINRGVNPAVAAEKVMAEMNRLLEQQAGMLDRTHGVMGGMMDVIGQGHRRQMATESVVARLEGMMRSQRWTKPAPWGTIAIG